MFYLIGLGLGDIKDITVKGLEIVKQCSRVYLEMYTSILGCSLEDMVSRDHSACVANMKRRAYTIIYCIIVCYILKYSFCFFSKSFMGVPYCWPTVTLWNREPMRFWLVLANQMLPYSLLAIPLAPPHTQTLFYAPRRRTYPTRSYIMRPL